jgi:HEAT repeat protein
MAVSLGSGKNRFLVVVGVVFVCAVVVAVVVWKSGRPDVTGGSERDRAAAVIRIASQRPSGARDSLSTAAQDESPMVRKAAIVGLTHLTEEMNSKDRPVIEKAVKDKDAGVRAVAAESLGQFNDAPATAELIRLLETDRDESVRMAALRGLVNCDDPRAIVAMVETAGKDASYDIKLQAGKSALRKAGGRLLPGRTPDNDVLWRDMIQRLKNDFRIRQAYAKAGVPLVDHPDDIAKRDLHGERQVPTAGPTTRVAPGKLK